MSRTTASASLIDCHAACTIARSSLRPVRALSAAVEHVTETDDLQPIVGETSRLPGYHALIATTGFTLGPLMARLLAEQMASSDPRPLPLAFSADRASHPVTS